MSSGVNAASNEPVTLEGNEIEEVETFTYLDTVSLTSRLVEMRTFKQGFARREEHLYSS